MNGEWKRICPKCEIEVFYITYSAFNNARWKNSVCKNCGNKNRIKKLKILSEQMKGISLEERVGKEKANKIKNKISEKLTITSSFKRFKGKKREEIVGPEKAKIWNKNNADSKRGIKRGTYIEQYGVERAKEINNKKIKSIKKTLNIPEIKKKMCLSQQGEKTDFTVTPIPQKQLKKYFLIKK